MTQKLCWDADPVVMLERAILPVIGAAPELLSRLLVNHHQQCPPDTQSALFAAFPAAEAPLRDGGAAFLKPSGIRIEGDDLRICQAAADAVAQTERALRDAVEQTSNGHQVPAAAAAQLTNKIASDMRPMVDDALDVFRRVFIGTVLDRQVIQARQAEAAIRQLSEISETIFFIAVNASVEAARAGDAGRGFAVIGQDIRALSLNARAATKGLRALMDKR